MESNSIYVTFAVSRGRNRTALYGFRTGKWRKVGWNGRRERERLTGTSFQYQRVGHCQKEVKEHEKRKRQEEK